MARKLNSQEVRVFAQAGSTEGQSLVADAEVILRSLMQRHDEALELSPESSAWFGDILPGSFGSRD